MESEFCVLPLKPRVCPHMELQKPSTGKVPDYGQCGASGDHTRDCMLTPIVLSHWLPPARHFVNPEPSEETTTVPSLICCVAILFFFFFVQIALSPGTEDS